MRSFAAKRSTVLDTGAAFLVIGTAAAAAAAIVGALIAITIKPKRKAAVRLAGKAVVAGASTFGAALGLATTRERYFDVNTYKDIGDNISAIDYDEVTKAESIAIALGSVKRGAGGEREYKKETAQIRNTLTRLLERAEL